MEDFLDREEAVASCTEAIEGGAEICEMKWADVEPTVERWW
ncbi:hypothetical protein [Nocardia farcinica]|nr:hypothetical protein [Nocardia farcinica]